MPVNEALILAALLAQVVLTLLVYVALISGRARSAGAAEEPPMTARTSRNLANQFELPVLFYALVLMLVVVNRVTLLDVVFAWIFVAARIVHAFGHIGRSDRVIRTPAFALSVAMVILLTIHAAFVVLTGLAA